MSSLSNLIEALSNIGHHCGTYATVERIDGKAVKMIDNRDDAYDTGITEISILSVIDHPNIVKIDNIKIGKRITFEMKYYSQKPSKNDWTYIMFKLLHACAYLEHNNIFHLDIKPNNIVYDGIEPILIDFSCGTYENKQQHVTMCSAYCAPEDDNNSTLISSKTDIWMLGATFYELITGQRYKQMNGKVTYGKLDAIPEQYRSLLSSMLEVDLSKRTTFKECLKFPIFASYTCLPLESCKLQTCSVRSKLSLRNKLILFEWIAHVITGYCDYDRFRAYANAIILILSISHEIESDKIQLYGIVALYITLLCRGGYLSIDHMVYLCDSKYTVDDITSGIAEVMKLVDYKPIFKLGELKDAMKFVTTFIINGEDVSNYASLMKNIVLSITRM